METGKQDPSLDGTQKPARAFDVTIDYPVSDTQRELGGVRIKDKTLMERVELIESQWELPDMAAR